MSYKYKIVIMKDGDVCVYNGKSESVIEVCELYASYEIVELDISEIR